ncbi:hypothetical protein GCM10022251_68790 [Phytohabitans flavus]|uniref:Uncharacterized protein n=1 Tax=Phytohabitans flavus TaxID=1076124 RepID=A0A6F8XUT1_9ACTN|nr:hypothetical protein Pflav_039960 [Phytohabitans flavus]
MFGVTFNFLRQVFAPVRVSGGPYAPAGTAQVGGSLALAEIPDPRCRVRGPSPTPTGSRSRIPVAVPIPDVPRVRVPHSPCYRARRVAAPSRKPTTTAFACARTLPLETGDARDLGTELPLWSLSQNRVGVADLVLIRCDR